MTTAEWHVFIISWTGQHPAAERMAAAFARLARCSVIWSDADPARRQPPGWTRLPDSTFFAGKWQCLLEMAGDAHVLMLTADADCADWPGLLARCQAAFAATPELGVWTPLVDWSSWRLEDYALDEDQGQPLRRVFQTDPIAWALHPAILRRMRAFDHAGNVYGYGIDTAACMAAHASGRLVALDRSVTVRHPRGTGYDEEAARRQGMAFLEQLSAAERTARDTLWAEAQRRRNAVRSGALFGPGRNSPCPCGSGRKYKHCHGA